MQNAEKLVVSLRRELGDMQERLGATSSARKSDPGSKTASVGGDHDLNWRFQQLQVQYDHLQGRAAAQDTMYKDSEHKVEVCHYSIIVSSLIQSTLTQTLHICMYVCHANCIHWICHVAHCDVYRNMPNVFVICDEF